MKRNRGDKRENYKRKSYLSIQNKTNIDNLYGFPLHIGSSSKTGWLVNVSPLSQRSEDQSPDIDISAVSIRIFGGEDDGGDISGVKDMDDGIQGKEPKSTSIRTTSTTPSSFLELFFVTEEGTGFKVWIPYRPYFYIIAKTGRETSVEGYLQRKFHSEISAISVVEKLDLEIPNHLSGIRGKCIKLEFDSVHELMNVRKHIRIVIARNRKTAKTGGAVMDINLEDMLEEERNPTTMADFIEDIKEYDVPYYVRVMIDLGIRVGYWYTVKMVAGEINIQRLDYIKSRASLDVFAYDIETVKKPLKFPDANEDEIMMISYMVNTEGYLIVNREVVNQDISDFEYTPKDEFVGKFHVFNEKNESAVIRRFFGHILKVKPNIFVTYNGDNFDWPYVRKRAELLGISMETEIGVYETQAGDGTSYFQGRTAPHMDVFSWVQRDSYLPQGSRGLKSVTSKKLGYDPLNVDPEDMCRLAREQPFLMASYSVSDALSTYYIYMRYVHPFIFSLCNILPMSPDDALRKGTGTLCEMLLMVRAYEMSIICPNKQGQSVNKLYKGSLIESETYIGGHVEALRSGIFRADIPMKFALDKKILALLQQNVDEHLKFAITKEAGVKSVNSVKNLNEIRDEILKKLRSLHEVNRREEVPHIYHLDVAAMYPNIILSNRLQPQSEVSLSTCAACIYNRHDSDCQRLMKWKWKGEVSVASRNEYENVKARILRESLPTGNYNEKGEIFAKFEELPVEKQDEYLLARVREYCRRVYGRVHDTVTEERTSIVCQREVPMYVDTVRMFRDRRYVYKNLLKRELSNLAMLEKAGENEEKIRLSKELITTYDSLQLAHKCILNSFYGYVMRRGSRWYSMEMAGHVTLVGSEIITDARRLLERIGIPLELDTDGVWCALPRSFPDNYKLLFDNGKRFTFSYPCTILNYYTHQKYTNHQYGDVIDESDVPNTFGKRSECSIFFEVDGPYYCMILPASKEENKKLKKRYAVFDFNHNVSEIKGFEMKRRGELKLIKNYQTKVFSYFLNGSNLRDAYDSAASHTSYWLNILFSRGQELDATDVLDLIAETRTISRAISSYGNQKSTALTTARRLADFLGEEMLLSKDSQTNSLTCKFVICKYPMGASIAERAIPFEIFSANESRRRHYLRLWSNGQVGDISLRELIDWEYYIVRFSSTVQKIISIPAALQRVPNPVRGVELPDWLIKRIRKEMDKGRQRTLDAHIKRDVGVKVVGVNLDADTDANVANPPEEESEGDISIEASTEKAAKRKRKHVNYETNFSEWIKQKASQWRRMLAARKKRRQRGGLRVLRADATGDARRGLAYVTTGQILRSSKWRILQLVIDNDLRPGELRCHVAVGKGSEISVMSAVVNLKRIFYINARRSMEGSGIGELTDKKIPYGAQYSSEFLYRVELDEEKFQRNRGAIEASLYSTGDHHGIFETKCPLLYQAIISMGAVCEYTGSASDSNAPSADDTSNYFELTSLQRLTASNEYISASDMNYIYLYHSSAGTASKRGFYGVADSHTKVILLVISNPFAKGEKENVPLLVRDVLARKKLGDWTFDIQFVKTLDAGLGVLSKAATKFISGRIGCTVAITQVPAYSHIQSHVAALKEIPVLEMTYNTQDCKYPPLAWQKAAAKSFLSRFAWVPRWLQSQVEYAKYSNIPIGNLVANNLGSPIPVHFILDVMFGRMLSESGYILWATNEEEPDLGGTEEYHENLDLVSSSSEIVHSNFYGGYSIEVDLFTLQLSTILVAEKMSYTEDKDGLAHDSDFLNTEGSAFSFPDSFRLLSKLAEILVEDAYNGIDVADSLTLSLQSWLSSASSLLYHPHVHFVLMKSTQQMLARVVAELTKLSARIVYASTDKLIISTQRLNLRDALEYTKFLLETLRSKQLFRQVQLSPQVAWLNLLFYDIRNYGGLEIPRELVEEVSGLIGKGDISEEKQYPSNFTDMNQNKWGIGTYLPEKVEKLFLSVVVNFVLSVSQMLRDRKRPDGLFTISEEIAGEIKAIVAGKISEDIYSFSEAIMNTYTNTISAREDFPDMPGVESPLINPSLEFLKYVCRILSLCEAAGQEIQTVKRNVLKIMRKNEYSVEAKFKHPAKSFVLCDVVCSFCSASCTLDLTRDTLPSKKTWNCPVCRNEIDKVMIERRLVKYVGTLVVNHATQDLICAKGCTSSIGYNMSKYCFCGADLVGRSSLEKMTREKLTVLASIAMYYDMKYLREYISQFRAEEATNKIH